MVAVGFPLNIVDVLAARLEAVVEGLSTRPLKRPLRLSDPAVSLGVHAQDWHPEGLQQIGQVEPTLGQYIIRVQTMVKHTNEEEGRALYTSMSKYVRILLYRDPQIRTQITVLSEDLLGTRERVQKFGVRQQRFLNNEFNSAMVYLGTTEFFVETEIVAL